MLAVTISRQTKYAAKKQHSFEMPYYYPFFDNCVRYRPSKTHHQLRHQNKPSKWGVNINITSIHLQHLGAASNSQNCSAKLNRESACRKQPKTQLTQHERNLKTLPKISYFSLWATVVWKCLAQAKATQRYYGPNS